MNLRLLLSPCLAAAVVADRSDASLVLGNLLQTGRDLNGATSA